MSGFNDFAEAITTDLNKFAYQRDDKELSALYYTYRQAIDNFKNITKKYLRNLPDLPDLPEPIGNDYYAGMIHLAVYCKKAAAEIARDSTKRQPAEQESTEGSGGKSVDNIQATAETEEDTAVRKKENQEGVLEPKPPEVLQKLLWLKQHGKKHWKLTLPCGIALLILWIVQSHFDLLVKILKFIRDIIF